MVSYRDSFTFTHTRQNGVRRVQKFFIRQVDMIRVNLGSNNITIQKQLTDTESLITESFLLLLVGWD
jgi:hypothetical protein